MKKLIAILSIILIIGTATVVSAAYKFYPTGPNYSYSGILFNGQPVTTSYGANNTTKAIVQMAYSDISGIETTVQSSSGKTSSPQYLNAYSDGLFTNVYNYPGEGVRARFYKTNINSGYQFDGKFYYNHN